MNGITLRHELRPGDVGWVVHRHGVLYAREYGWDARFEAYVAEALAAFALDHDPHRERLWLAETDGRIVGSIGIVDSKEDIGSPHRAEPPATAQLRWFLVEPDRRGLGIGHRLVDEALAFCRATGRRRVVLWTVAGLDAAAHLYRRAGFSVAEQAPGRRWGSGIVEERYELLL